MSYFRNQYGCYQILRYERFEERAFGEVIQMAASVFQTFVIGPKTGR
jgi:hypothetical protein